MMNIISDYLVNGNLPTGDATICKVDDTAELFPTNGGGATGYGGSGGNNTDSALPLLNNNFFMVFLGLIGATFTLFA